MAVAEDAGGQFPVETHKMTTVCLQALPTES